MSKLTDGWEGAFALYQNRDFAILLAKHHRLKVLDLDGLLILQKRFPVLGSMGCLLGGPEKAGTYQQWRVGYDKLHFSHILIQTNQKLDSLQGCCISPEDNCNMVVCLPSVEEELLPTFQTRKRRTIKKTRSEKKVTITQVRTTEQLSDLYAIVQQTSQNGELFPLPDFPLLLALWEAHFLTAFVASHDGASIGGTFHLLSEKTMHGWAGGVLRDYMNLNAWDLLHYHSMCWGIKHNYKYYDMGDQSPTQQPNMTGYKMRFRPEIIPCYHYKVIRSRTKYFLTSIKKHLSS